MSMLTKEDIKTQVVKEALVWADAETERRFAHIVAQKQLQNCGFLNNNLDEMLATIEERNRSGRFISPDRPLPPFEFTSQQEIADGRNYSFKVRNVVFHGASVYKVAVDAEDRNHYRCGPYTVVVEG